MKPNIFNDHDEDEKIADTLFKKLFPICRSITGNGVRKSLKILQEISFFEIKEIKSGTKCYDWVVPEEWNISDAYIKNSSGEKIIDFNNNNLHVMSYSVPINKSISFNELKKHIHTLQELPDAIPYRTSYYKKDWGFCLKYNQYKELNQNETYSVVIDSQLKSGSLTYGEIIIKGKSDKEILISTYCCHPSMGNDNLSGLILTILLLKKLKLKKPFFTYRFVIVPETIGAIAYLAQNEKKMQNVLCGFVITCVAGPGKIGFKKTFLGNHELDKIIEQELTILKDKKIAYDFHIIGSDERQYSSPFFRIPICSITKSKYYEYDYYHTSLDNLDFVSPKNLVETLKVYCNVIEKIEFLEESFLSENKEKVIKVKGNGLFYLSNNTKCEPMLSKRKIYPTIGGSITPVILKNNITILKSNNLLYDPKKIGAVLWILFYSDGKTSLDEIEKKSSITLSYLKDIANELVRFGLIKKIDNF